MDDARDVALFYADLLCLFCSIRPQLRINSRQAAGAHRFFRLLFYNAHHRFHGILAAARFLGDNRDRPPGNPELDRLASAKPGLPSDGFGYNNGRESFSHDK
jgi:hypothetical protein